jgi:hypothetical protein
MPHKLDRRSMGAVLGAILGFSYSLVAQTINYFVVPDISLYSDGNILFRIIFSTMAGGFLGFVVNAFSNGAVGVLVGSLVGMAAIIVGGLSRATSTSSEATALVAFTLLYTFIPMTVLFMPLTALLRWATGYYSNEGVSTFSGIFSRWRYLRVVLGLVTVAVLFGSFVMIPDEGRTMLKNMDNYIHQAQISGVEKVPTAFQSVAEVVKTASSKYTLEWTDDLSKYPSSLGSEDAPAQVTSLYNLVIARFESGEKIICIFRLDGGLYICLAIE